MYRFSYIYWGLSPDRGTCSTAYYSKEPLSYFAYILQIAPLTEEILDWARDVSTSRRWGSPFHERLDCVKDITTHPGPHKTVVNSFANVCILCLELFFQFRGMSARGGKQQRVLLVSADTEYWSNNDNDIFIYFYIFIFLQLRNVFLNSAAGFAALQLFINAVWLLLHYLIQLKLVRSCLGGIGSLHRLDTRWFWYLHFWQRRWRFWNSSDNLRHLVNPSNCQRSSAIFGCC